MAKYNQREKALIGAIAKHAAEMGLSKDREIADHIGITPQSFAVYKGKNFQMHGLTLFSIMARRLGFTGKEVCAIVGVPYEDSDY